LSGHQRDPQSLGLQPRKDNEKYPTFISIRNPSKKNEKPPPPSEHDKPAPTSVLSSSRIPGQRVMPHHESPPMAPAIMVNKAGDSTAPPPTQEDVNAILSAILSAKTSHASVEAAYNLTELLQNSVGFRGLKGYGVLDEIKKAATDKKSPIKREGAMNALGALFERFPRVHKLGEVVFLIQEDGLLLLALDSLADKTPAVKESARYALDQLFDNLNAEAKVFGLLPVLVKRLGKQSGKWQGAVGALELMGRMADKAKMGMESLEVEKEKDILREAMGKRLESLIPVVESGMHDLKTEVSLTQRINGNTVLTYF
jgi:elongation factor 3